MPHRESNLQRNGNKIVLNTKIGSLCGCKIILVNQRDDQSSAELDLGKTGSVGTVVSMRNI